MKMLEEIKIGFIGFGNMASAMADGWIHSTKIAPCQMYACARNYEKLKNNTQKRGMNACHTASEVVENSDMIILAVKPYMIEDVVAPIKHLFKGKIVVSVAAGFNYERYMTIFDESIHHISTIPNTPVAIGEGIIICENKHALTNQEFSLFQELFALLGLVEIVETHQLSAAGTLSGCGPAFASLFIEALADAGVKYGLTRPMSYRLASQMIAGTGKMQILTGKHPGVMKDEVCSPGGTTIKGVTKMEEAGFRNAVIQAIDAIEGK